ncbi:N-methyl-L-tryptophan oxidase [Halobium salinum]|uniref:N-methyl-L-tryptophan oxidase n=1 Tax=Halobium salinum TaxID=1364940 RepID=A0ABD5PGA2_9EURY|nr:N-methyl-L-tryptophan oxidase [Halobium salinum]
MTDRYDVIVVGVGGVGSAAVSHLAGRGADVLGLERFDVPHARGSSHGSTRIIRKAYFEDPAYVSLVERAYENWRALERATGRDLLTVTGSVDAGPEGSEVVEGSLRSCREHDLEHDFLTGAELHERVPGLDLPNAFRAVHQPEGGFLHAEGCIEAHVQHAHAHGAEVRAREAVTDWRETGEGVRVDTDRGRYEADTLVVAAGPWTGELLPDLADSLRPERQVIAWFQPDRSERYRPESFPVFVCTVPDDEGRGIEGGEYYGIPTYRRPGVKLGKHHHLGGEVDPESVEEPTRADEAVVRRFAETYAPDAAGPTMGLDTCLYTNTPDDDFVVDRHPAHDSVVVAGGFSGHGFKFTSATGELLADLALDGETTFDVDLDPFRVDRL